MAGARLRISRGATYFRKISGEHGRILRRPESSDGRLVGGGSQTRIADAYCATLVETQLFTLLKRGGVIGGSSAGAAIQSKVMIAGGRTQPQLKTGLDFCTSPSLTSTFWLVTDCVDPLVRSSRSHRRSGLASTKAQLLSWSTTLQKLSVAHTSRELSNKNPAWIFAATEAEKEYRLQRIQTARTVNTDRIPSLLAMKPFTVRYPVKPIFANYDDTLQMQRVSHQTTLLGRTRFRRTSPSNSPFSF